MTEYIDKIFVERMLKAITDDEELIINALNSLPTADVIPIPMGATNGDMVKSLFPSERGEQYIHMTPTHLMYDGLDYLKEFRKEWWNAPYDVGGDEHESNEY